MGKLKESDLIKLSNQGCTSKAIVAWYQQEKGIKVSRQTVDKYRQELAQRGLIVQPHRGRGPAKRIKSSGNNFDLDKGVASLIGMAGLAAEVPALKQEIWWLKNKLAAAENELKVLREDKQKRDSQKAAWQLAVQQGDVKPALSEQ